MVFVLASAVTSSAFCSRSRCHLVSRSSPAASSWAHPCRFTVESHDDDDDDDDDDDAGDDDDD
eukprot:10115489-Karenia_brevis.AAC.1